ncbi:MAG TPA: hypothetical protein VFH40_14810 [Gemmatimonadales bacterium]|jgi:hypothetical protein|nr:hypothetical protein [Gemmatimonadales bacterium]
MARRVPFALVDLLLIGAFVSGCAPVESSVSRSAPHLPVPVLAKSATRSSPTNQPLCPTTRGYPNTQIPRDSVEASWRWPQLAWRLSCPGTMSVVFLLH